MLKYLRFGLSLLVVGLIGGGQELSAAQTNFISKGAVWKYLDNGGTDFRPPFFFGGGGSFVPDWKSSFYPDTHWSSGPAQLGYGDGDEATVVSYGVIESNKHITTYFRHTFNVSNAARYSRLFLKLLRDDGAVVYLNGTEVFRSNMPGTTITSSTLASKAVETAEENLFFTKEISRSLLLEGSNLLAVEIHQAAPDSSDISFDLELIGSDEIGITRGPYLQSSTPTATTLRWRTSQATNSVVRFGTDPTQLTNVITVQSNTVNHEVRLTNLTPDTQYFYSLAAGTQVLTTGPEYMFYTPQLTGGRDPVRVWVIGDSGTANADARAVRDAYYNFTTNRYTDLWLMLGDNAYQTGTDAQYQAAVFDMYPEILRQTVLWSTLGNHDSALSTNPGPYPYHSIFTFPTNGEAGGLPSGNEDYYSFDHANIHFVCLNSMTADRDATAPMLTWLKNDLAANTQPWTIAFFHHPPYTKGSHDSDTEIELIEMRENALPILEEYGVDLVLTGHSHSYERSFLIDGHYGNSTTLTPQMIKNNGSGQPENGGAYAKSKYGPASHEGAVYIVAGSSGQISGGELNHPAMFVSLDELGSLVLDITANKLEAAFLTSTGAIHDRFTIERPLPPPPNDAPTVVLTNPQEGQSFRDSDSILLSATATDTGPIESVSFYAGTELLSTDIEAPYEHAWGTLREGSYTVTAVVRDVGGLTNTSPTVTFTVASSGTTKTPTAPAKLKASATGPRAVTLQWQDKATNETGYRVERALKNKKYEVVATLPANATSYEDTTVEPNTNYQYKVRAIAGNRLSNASNAAKVKTPSE